MADRRLSITELLNPALDNVGNTSNLSHPPPTASLSYTAIPSFQAPRIETNVFVHRKATLSTLYIYEDPTAYVEYPSTGQAPVGYKFRQDISNWKNPTRNFAYSLGRPSGSTLPGKEVVNKLMFDEANVETLIPCKKTHYTCQGSKICPMSDVEKLSEPHSIVEPKDIQSRLALQQEFYRNISSPSRDIFVKTAAYITALRKVGCRAPRYEETRRNIVEERAYLDSLEHHTTASRGYTPPDLCDGRLLLEYDHSDKPFIRCEHYSHRGNRDHFIQYLDDSYDVEYLDAYFNEDFDELERIEQAALKLGYGPQAECSVAINFSSQRACCPNDHRIGDNKTLLQPKLHHLSCDVTIHVYEPLPEYRASCPWSLVVCRGIHHHPIPIPQKTPPQIHLELVSVLKSLDHDLPDLTPRRLLRHPVLASFLRSRVPQICRPTLADLHISLANRSHVKYYIDQVKAELFPHGTGWKGVRHLKENQDSRLPRSEHYVRRVLEYPLDGLDAHDEDIPDRLENEPDENSDSLRIIVCMTQESSRRMLSAQYVQSDIGFKRVVGYYEFEIASLDRMANSSITFCRVFLNKQSAVAHEKVFAAIEDVVLSDTGQTLKWRHIHATGLDDPMYGMILQWTGDQHGGQAKGLGLHLQKVARHFPGKYDLYDPNRLLTSLSPYEHLRRLFRLCYVHGMRNIRKISASDEVRNTMRGLICTVHDDWDGAIEFIMQSGNKGAIDWVNDKIRSGFAFEAMCWEKSLIPIEIWRAGERDSNLIESVHSDVNREGVHCTLIGGIKKGQEFDNLKLKTIFAFELGGIRPSYSSGHLFVNATKNLKRKLNAHHQTLEGEDTKIEQHNKRLLAANQRVAASGDPGEMGSTANAQMVRRAEQAKGAFIKQVDVGRSLIGSGSGKVGIYLPLNESR